MPQSSRFGSLAEYWGRLPLRRQLALLVLATAVPLLLAAGLMFARLVSSERETMRREFLLSAKITATLVDNEIETHTAIASTLAHSPALLADDLPAFWLEAEQALEFVPGAWLSLVSVDGQILLNTMKPLGAPLPLNGALDVMKRGFETHRPQVGDLVMGPVSKQLSAFVVVPVFRDGKPIYAISVSLEPARFLALINKHFTHGEVVGILDRNQRFVARVPDNESRLGSLASNGWRAAILKAPEGWAENLTLEGNASLTGYTQTANGWTVGVAWLESDITETSRRILFSSVLMSVILTLLSFALATILAQRAVAGMRALSRAAADMGQGRSPSTLQQPFAEAGVIAEALSAAASEIKDQRELILHSNANLEAKVVERTQDVIDQMHKREELEAELRQVQKLESIGQLTGGIAHDFNNMLTVISGNLDTILRRLPAMESAAIERHVQAAQKGAAMAAQLTHRLLAFARRQPLAPARVEINSLILGILDLLRRTVGETIEIGTELESSLWPVFADAGQIENSLVNLVVNARDAIEGGGKILIRTANVAIDAAAAAADSNFSVGPYVMVSVGDTGKGISNEQLHHIFEPFFTTKEVGKGTGLGLAMIYGFVKQSGGAIGVKSRLGLGTTVELYLPRRDHAGLTGADVATSRDAAAPNPPRAPRGETILLVEDEPDVRDYAAAALEELGYRVTAARDGVKALQMLADGAHVDLLFTDITLPGGMSGAELAIKAKALHPTLPVLYTTGYASLETIEATDLHGDMLIKPYTLSALAEKVRSAMDRAVAKG